MFSVVLNGRRVEKTGNGPPYTTFTRIHEARINGMKKLVKNINKGKKNKWSAAWLLFDHLTDLMTMSLSAGLNMFSAIENNNDKNQHKMVKFIYWDFYGEHIFNLNLNNTRFDVFYHIHTLSVALRHSTALDNRLECVACHTLSFFGTNLFWNCFLRQVKMIFCEKKVSFFIGSFHFLRIFVDKKQIHCFTSTEIDVLYSLTHNNNNRRIVPLHSHNKMK